MEETATTTAQETVETTATEQQPAAAASSQDGEKQQSDNNAKLETLIQKAVDRATNQLGNENKRLRTENEKLIKASMDADELKQFELSEKEKEIAAREAALTEKENRLTAIKAIKEAGLDDGSDASLAIVDFVMAEDEDGIKERVKAFDALVKRIVESKVGAVFKANGRTPGVGSDTAKNAGGNNDSIAARMGRNAAEINQKSSNIRNKYINGGKK